MQAESSVTRFWAKVGKRGPDECWPWMAATTYGYGVLGMSDGRSVRAHRFSYELHLGAIPPGLCVCHRCDNPPCCNPRHLFLGTRGENNADMAAKGRAVSWVQQGRTAPRARLTCEDVLEIRRLCDRGEASYAALARRYGVHESTVSLAAKRRTWTHLV